MKTLKGIGLIVLVIICIVPFSVAAAAIVTYAGIAGAILVLPLGLGWFLWDLIRGKDHNAD